MNGLTIRTTLTCLLVLIATCGRVGQSFFFSPARPLHSQPPAQPPTAALALQTSPFRRPPSPKLMSPSAQLGSHDEPYPTTRREALQRLGVTAGLTSAAAAAGGWPGVATALVDAAPLPESQLVWSPIGSGRTLTKQRRREESSPAGRYPVRFVAYLTRFLLNFDRDVQQWWVAQAAELPPFSSPGAVQELRRRRFGQLAKTVEVGLKDYSGERGETALLSLMRSRYSNTIEEKRQLAILFTFIDGIHQPVPAISKLIAAVDNASIADVCVLDGGCGYSPEAPLPLVQLSAPLAPGRQRPGDSGQPWQAVARVKELRALGNVQQLRLVSKGSGYVEAPGVVVSPPSGNGHAARARAILGPGGSIAELRLLDGGDGYTDRDNVEVSIDGVYDGELAVAAADLDFAVATVEVVNPGFGYGSTQDLEVQISPPALDANAGGRSATAAAQLSTTDASTTAGTNPDVWLPRRVMLNEFSELLPSSMMPYYDQTRRRYIIPEVEFTPPKSATQDPIFGGLAARPVQRELSLTPTRFVKFAAAGAVCTAIIRASLSPLELVKTQLQLAPKGTFVQVGKDGETRPDWLVCAEALMEPQYAVMPQEPTVNERARGGGVANLFRGADASGVTGLVLGGLSFAQVELFRRSLDRIIGPSGAELYSLPIVLTSTLGAVFLTSIAVCPLEAARVKLMSTVENATASTLRGALSSMVEVGGFLSLWSSLGPLLLREVAFSLPKFVVFNSFSALLYRGLPQAQETLTGTLAISLVAGAVAGISGAIVSAPADLLLTNEGAGAADDVQDQDEPESSAVFAGVGVRCVFFAASISVQFFLNDYFKALLGVAPADLTEGLDVFADRLSFYYDAQ